MEQAESYFVTYAPIIIVVLAFIFKNKIFVTPEQLEKKHKGILQCARQIFSIVINCLQQLHNMVFHPQMVYAM